uniref:F-box domain-containing protein n=1 Tax=Moniliophthora roreri TaxID=221103 RepID=A0A0W0FBK6_MONRR
MLRLRQALSQVEAAKLKEILPSVADKQEGALYRALLAPIRRLPPEILSQVFILTEARTTLAPKSQSELASLGSVCTYWRTVSQNTPDVWGSLTLRITAGTYPRGILQILELHLQRSRYLKVVLHLDDADITQWQIYIQNLISDYNGLLTVQEKLIKTLMQHAPRIEELIFCCCRGILTDKEVLLPFFNHFGSHFQALKKLSLDASAWNTLVATVLNTFPGPPHLTSIHISTLYNIKQISDGSAKFSQITNIEIGWVSAAGAFAFLKHCPNVVSASFGIAFPDVEDEKLSEQSQLRLSCLEALTISLPDDEWSVENLYICAFLDALALPALVELSFLGVEDVYDFHLLPRAFVPSISNMIVRSSAPVQKFRMERMPVSDTELLALLVRIPKLSELVIGETDLNWQEPGKVVTTEFIRRLSSLRHLKLLVTNPRTEEHTSAIDAMFNSGLQSLYLQIENENVDLDRFRDMQRKGLAVRVVRKLPRGQLMTLLGYGLGDNGQER